ASGPTCSCATATALSTSDCGSSRQYFAPTRIAVAPYAATARTMRMCNITAPRAEPPRVCAGGRGGWQGWSVPGVVLVVGRRAHLLQRRDLPGARGLGLP